VVAGVVVAGKPCVVVDSALKPVFEVDVAKDVLKLD